MKYIHHGRVHLKLSYIHMSVQHKIWSKYWIQISTPETYVIILPVNILVLLRVTIVVINTRTISSLRMKGFILLMVPHDSPSLWEARSGHWWWCSLEGSVSPKMEGVKKRGWALASCFRVSEGSPGEAKVQVAVEIWAFWRFQSYVLISKGICGLKLAWL